MHKVAYRELFASFRWLRLMPNLVFWNYQPGLIPRRQCVYIQLVSIWDADIYKPEGAS